MPDVKRANLYAPERDRLDRAKVWNYVKTMPYSGKCKVRPARRNDLNTLQKIWLELMHMHENNDRSFALAADGLQKWLQMAEDMLDRDDTFVFTALEGSHAVGFCLGWIARNPPIYRLTDVGFISEVAVAKEAQRRGVGSALIAAARRWFLERRLTEFQLSTAVWNEPARRFWESIGGEALLVRYRFDVHR